jgi:hypothetical protein
MENAESYEVQMKQERIVKIYAFFFYGVKLSKNNSKQNNVQNVKYT